MLSQPTSKSISSFYIHTKFSQFFSEAKTKNLMAQKDHCIRIWLDSFTFRWTLAVIKVFFWSQYRMWNVFRERASHRIVYRVVLFVCFFPKTWRKLMVLCNISLTCWIIYSPRSMLARSRTHTWMMWWKKSKMNVRAAYHNRSYHRTPNKLWWVFSLFAQHHQSFGFKANSFSSFFASQLINNEKVFFEVLLFHWNISIEIWHLFDINSILKGIFFLYHPP